MFRSYKVRVAGRVYAGTANEICEGLMLRHFKADEFKHSPAPLLAFFEYQRIIVKNCFGINFTITGKTMEDKCLKYLKVLEKNTILIFLEKDGVKKYGEV